MRTIWWAAAAAILLSAGCKDAELDERRPDILLISLDTVRVDDVSAHGGTPGTTPFLE